MGRIGEVVRRTFQTADVMKRVRGGAGRGPADNERVLRYLAKLTVNVAITHGLDGARREPAARAPRRRRASGSRTSSACGRSSSSRAGSRPGVPAATANATTILAEPDADRRPDRRARRQPGAAVARLPRGRVDGRRPADLAPAGARRELPRPVRRRHGAQRSPRNRARRSRRRRRSRSTASPSRRPPSMRSRCPAGISSGDGVHAGLVEAADTPTRGRCRSVSRGVRENPGARPICGEWSQIPPVALRPLLRSCPARTGRWRNHRLSHRPAPRRASVAPPPRDARTSTSTRPAGP